MVADDGRQSSSVLPTPSRSVAASLCLSCAHSYFLRANSCIRFRKKKKKMSTHTAQTKNALQSSWHGLSLRIQSGLRAERCDVGCCVCSKPQLIEPTAQSHQVRSADGAQLGSAAAACSHCQADLLYRFAWSLMLFARSLIVNCEIHAVIRDFPQLCKHSSAGLLLNSLHHSYLIVSTHVASFS